MSGPDNKAVRDINTLSEKNDICSAILKENGGKFDYFDETLLAVIGFLEACTPRTVKLVEAATKGGVKESALVRCLEVNDRLLKVVSECDK